jgi:hypothetical protein
MAYCQAKVQIYNTTRKRVQRLSTRIPLSTLGLGRVYEFLVVKFQFIAI